jgi:heat shock protein HtpX
VSTGLLTAANPSELEGLLAHELALIRRRDVMVQTTAALLSSAIVELSRIGGFARNAFLAILGPIAASLTHLLLSPQRTFAADRAAAALCDSPHGLADALLRLEAAQGMVAFAASPATEPLYAISPFAPDRLSAMFSTHPSTAERISRLRALDPEWRERLRATLDTTE